MLLQSYFFFWVITDWPVKKRPRCHGTFILLIAVSTEHPHICQLKDKGWLFCWLDMYAIWKSEKNASFLLCVIFFSTSFYTFYPNLPHFLAASNKPPLTSLDKHSACRYIIIYRYTTLYNNINCLNISEISSKYPLTIHQMSIRYPSSNYSLKCQGYFV